MKSLYLEFYKSKRKKIWVIIAALIIVQLFWAGTSAMRWRVKDLAQGWRIFLYQFSMLNCILMPVIAAITASRIADLEHRGDTLKLLRTIQTPAAIFNDKLICGAVYMMAAAVFQILTMIGIGRLLHFTEEILWDKFGLYLLATFTISFTIYLIQQVLSLIFQNQMIPLSIGLAGGFLGLMTMFFPESVQKMLIWGYYGVLSVSRMDWDPISRNTDMYWIGFNWNGFYYMLFLFMIIYMIGRAVFIKKEV